MSLVPNQRAYRFYAPIYDRVFRRLSEFPRARAVELLALRPGETLLIPGFGTGLDVPHIPPGVRVVGLDYSPEMLGQARPKVRGRAADLVQGDAQRLPIASASVDALLFCLALSVFPDGAAAFREAWRALRPGGRAAVFDKFIPEGGMLTWQRRWLGRIVRALGTDPNRRLGDILGDAGGVSVAHDEPSLLRGQYRILRLNKRST